MKIRFLSAAAVVTAGALVLTGCDSKVGTAAVVNGHKISESTVSGYLTPTAQPLQGQNGSSTAPRTFVLQYLIRTQIFERVLTTKLKTKNQTLTDALLDGAKTAALSGASEDALTKQITSVGLSSSFEPQVLRYQELYTLIGTEFDVTTTAGQNAANAALAGSNDKVVVNPRYGAWDAKTITLADLSQAQLPSFLKFDTALPGDAPAA